MFNFEKDLSGYFYMKKLLRYCIGASLLAASAYASAGMNFSVPWDDDDYYGGRYGGPYDGYYGGPSRSRGGWGGSNRPWGSSSGWNSRDMPWSSGSRNSPWGSGSSWSSRDMPWNSNSRWNDGPWNWGSSRSYRGYRSPSRGNPYRGGYGNPYRGGYGDPYYGGGYGGPDTAPAVETAPAQAAPAEAAPAQ